MKWDDNLLLEGDVDPVRGQIQLAIYALHLSSGGSIHCKQLKPATVEKIIRNVALYIMLFSGIDFRKDHPSDQHMGHILSPVYRDLRAYEALPNRREPYTLDMQALAHAEASHQSLSQPHSILPTLCNGFGAGLNAGFRLSEWAQPGGRRDPQYPLPALNPRPGISPTKAVVPNDLMVVTACHRRLAGLDILSVDLLDILRLLLTFRYQKNGQHGEERMFTQSDDPDTPHSMIPRLYNALHRFQALQALDPSLDPAHTPLFVYWDPLSSRVCLPTSVEIEAFMRGLAARCYHLDPVADKAALQRWSSHSLRVGACVLLHSMGFPPQDIKWLLRWLSDAFMAYLRNTAVLATRQHRALDAAASMPHLV